MNVVNAVAPRLPFSWWPQPGTKVPGYRMPSLRDYGANDYGANDSGANNSGEGNSDTVPDPVPEERHTLASDFSPGYAEQQSPSPGGTAFPITTSHGPFETCHNAGVTNGAVSPTRLLWMSHTKDPA